VKPSLIVCVGITARGVVVLVRHTLHPRQPFSMACRVKPSFAQVQLTANRCTYQKCPAPPSPPQPPCPPLPCMPGAPPLPPSISHSKPMSVSRSCSATVTETLPPAPPLAPLVPRPPLQKHRPGQQTLVIQIKRDMRPTRRRIAPALRPDVRLSSWGLVCRDRTHRCLAQLRGTSAMEAIASSLPMLANPSSPAVTTATVQQEALLPTDIPVLAGQVSFANSVNEAGSVWVVAQADMETPSVTPRRRIRCITSVTAV
jgi:hypothetical protein